MVQHLAPLSWVFGVAQKPGVHKSTGTSILSSLQELLRFHYEGHHAGIHLDVRGISQTQTEYHSCVLQHADVQGLGVQRKEGACWDKEST